MAYANLLKIKGGGTSDMLRQITLFCHSIGSKEPEGLRFLLLENKEIKIELIFS